MFDFLSGMATGTPIDFLTGFAVGLFAAATLVTGAFAAAYTCWFAPIILL